MVQNSFYVYLEVYQIEHVSILTNFNTGVNINFEFLVIWL